MKKLVPVLLLSMMALFTHAQNESKYMQIGVATSSLTNNFGFIFKTGEPSSMWRFMVLTANIGSNKTSEEMYETTQMNSGITAKFGREYRTKLSGKLDFVYGGELSFGYTYQKTENSEENDLINSKLTTYSPGINALLGVVYPFSDRFSVSAEIMPGVRYNTGIEKSEYINSDQNYNREFSGWGIGLNSNSVLFTLSYKL
jgi:hypothetical protein